MANPGFLFPRMAVPTSLRATALRHAPNLRSFVSSTSSARVPISRPASTWSQPSFRSSNVLPAFSLSRSGLQYSKATTAFQRRSFVENATRNLLANIENSAKNNPNSASAQNVFYTALLRNNMPAIVVERYRSGHYAANHTTEQLYRKALNSLGVASTTGASYGSATQMGSAGDSAPQLTQGERLGAVAPAVARHTGIDSGDAKLGFTGAGSPKDPLVVRVSERWHTVVFRWLKFALIFGATCYFLLVSLSLFVETTGMAKNIRGGVKDSEVKPEKQTVRFSDVHGCDTAKEDLQDVVDFLQNPQMFTRLGGKLPKGVLLVGPPGTGKTLLARAVAGEAGVPYFYMSGSEFDEMYVGVGAKRVRDLFAQARAKAPAIIFIDELDAIGAKRNEKDQVYVKQTLNQLLTELDGFTKTEGIIIIGATNYPQLLDKALVRPGRFDRKVNVGLPDVRGRIDILKHHLKNIQISTDVDASIIARGTIGFSGADLENLINQAAIRASRQKKAKVEALDFDWARDKIIMGAENRMFIQDADKKLTAYHEAGHALVAYYSPRATPLYKITIAPRGGSLGATHFLPKMDMVSKNYSEYLSDIDVSLGGKVAEEMIYGSENTTSGISQDLVSATDTAWNLVCRLGYSPTLGSVELASNYDRLSSETKQKIEHEVRRLVEEGRDRATKILTDHKTELETLCKALLEYETLTKEEMERVLKGQKLQRLGTSETPKKPSNDRTTPDNNSSDDGDSNGPQGKKQSDTNKDGKATVGLLIPGMLKPGASTGAGATGTSSAPRPPPGTPTGQ